jgi:D-alanyl-D-alanine carboxypeptidase
VNVGFINHQPQNNNFQPAMGLRKPKINTTTKHLAPVVSQIILMPFYGFFIRVHTIPNQSSSDSHHNVQRAPYRRKIQFGIKTGFTKVGYQSIIAERVTVPEK